MSFSIHHSFKHGSSGFVVELKDDRGQILLALVHLSQSTNIGTLEPNAMNTSVRVNTLFTRS